MKKKSATPKKDTTREKRKTHDKTADRKTLGLLWGVKLGGFTGKPCWGASLVGVAGEVVARRFGSVVGGVVAPVWGGGLEALLRES